LYRLSTAEGDLTTNVDLIEGLETTKAVSVEIAKKSVIAKAMSEKINVISEKYRSVATRGSVLFFLMNNLFKTHTFYVFSLAAYVTVFLRGIRLTGKPEALLAKQVPAQFRKKVSYIYIDRNAKKKKKTKTFPKKQTFSIYYVHKRCR
jgi:hypothetical protein